MMMMMMREKLIEQKALLKELFKEWSRPTRPESLRKDIYASALEREKRRGRRLEIDRKRQVCSRESQGQRFERGPEKTESFLLILFLFIIGFGRESRLILYCKETPLHLFVFVLTPEAL